MGLLDDAIREHLELRRRMGADASEVARMEQEALGPVVRGELFVAPEPVVDAEPADDVEHEQQLDIHDALEEPAPYEPADEQLAYGDAAAEGPSSEYLPAPHQHELEHEVDSEPAYVPPPGVGQETVEYDVDAVHEAEAAMTPPPNAEPDLLEATAVHEVVEVDGVHSPAPVAPSDEEHGVAAPDSEHPAIEPHEPPAHEVETPEEQAAEDVLEQTPEFLQETPEHDRLWFEQAPPKDFDFDK